MRNITVSVDEETHRLARIRAAELDTSVSALVREFLRGLADGSPAGRASHDPEGEPGQEDTEETNLESRRRNLRQVFADFDARGVGLSMSENLSREEIYDRGRARDEAEWARMHLPAMDRE